MGKQIDLSDVTQLSSADLQYALQRNMLTKDHLRELDLTEHDIMGMLGGHAPAQIEVDHVGDRLVLTEEERQHILARRQANDIPTIDPEGLGRVLVREEGDDNSDDGEEEAQDYDDWSNDDLRAELFQRELSVDGKKRDLVARLREFDEAKKLQEEQQAAIDAGQ